MNHWIEDQREKNREINEKMTELTGSIGGQSLAIDQCDNQINRLKKSMEETQLPKLQAELDEKQSKLVLAQVDLGNLEDELQIIQNELEVQEFWLKDVFAANGLKAYIFKAMLDQLNQYTTKYGTKLGCSMRFSLDLTKVSAPFSTVCTLGDKVNKDYKEFSGGERSRLDIILLMAMHDLLSSSVDINVLILDEVFEGLDFEGVSTVLELLSEKGHNKSVYIITHAEAIDVMHSKTIEIENIDGKTILP